MKIQFALQNNFDFYWIHSVHIKFNIGQWNKSQNFINRKAIPRVSIGLYTGGWGGGGVWYYDLSPTACYFLTDRLWGTETIKTSPH